MKALERALAMKSEMVSDLLLLNTCTSIIVRRGHTVTFLWATCWAIPAQSLCGSRPLPRCSHPQKFDAAVLPQTGRTSPAAPRRPSERCAASREMSLLFTSGAWCHEGCVVRMLCRVSCFVLLVWDIRQMKKVQKSVKHVKRWQSSLGTQIAATAAQRCSNRKSLRSRYSYLPFYPSKLF